MKFHRILIRTVLTAVLASLSPKPVFGTIVDGKVTGGDSLAAGGHFEKLPIPLPNPLGQPNSVGDDTFNSPNLFGFDESQNFIGASPLDVDVSLDGQPGTIPARTELASHYVFFDPPPGIPHQIGYVDFSGEIVGVITSRSNLLASDYLTNAVVHYLSPAKRGLEAGDSATIDPNHPSRLLVNWAAGSPGDYVRVLTRPAPPVRQYWAANGHYYEVILAQGGISWSDANAIALARGGYLASITSAEENAFVFGLASDPKFWILGGNKYFGPWLGGLQLPDSIEPAGGWTWSTHEPFAFSNWAPGQPTNTSGNEDRIQYGGSTNIANYWNDLADGNAGHAPGFVVEYELNPAPVVSIELSGKSVDLKWPASVSRTYSVLWTAEIVGGSWTVLTNVFGVDGELTVRDQLSSQKRYYRVGY